MVAVAVAVAVDTVVAVAAAAAVATETSPVLTHVVAMAEVRTPKNLRKAGLMIRLKNHVSHDFLAMILFFLRQLRTCSGWGVRCAYHLIHVSCCTVLCDFHGIGGDRGGGGGGGYSSGPSRGGGPSDPNDCKLYVGKINYKTTEDVLADAFSKFGRVVSCQVLRERETNRSRGFGFVTFGDPNDAQDAIRGMDGGSSARDTYLTVHPRGARTWCYEANPYAPFETYKLTPPWLTIRFNIYSTRLDFSFNLNINSVPGAGRELEERTIQVTMSKPKERFDGAAGT